MPEVGDPAPEFTSKTDAGATVALRDLRGKKVVLYFYPQDDTPGCTREACDFRDNTAAVQAKGAVVLGVSPDSVASHAAFKQKFGLPFLLLSDEDKAIVTAYGVWKPRVRDGQTVMRTERTTFIIDERGIITHVFPEVKVDGHVAEVLAALGS
ncbi:MAG: peroxiredoxin [Armatimonadota bacterium]